MALCFCGGACDFYPRSPCGERRYSLRHSAQMRYFYPRSPCGERHDTSSLMQCQAKFLSTLSLRRATARKNSKCRCLLISIHALLAESDRETALQCVETPEFLSTLSLRRATSTTHMLRFCALIFLSTLSLRRATNTQQRHFPKHPQFLSTLSLRRATAQKNSKRRCLLISIHALLAESDLNSAYGALDGASISIHALLAESDVFLLRKITITVDISIHALLAESDILGRGVVVCRMSFLSTLSLRRATILSDYQL